MKPRLTTLLLIICLSSCNIFKKSQYVPPIGAEKLLAYQQPGYKPKNKKDKAEYEAAKKQMRADDKLAKKQTIPNY